MTPKPGYKMTEVGEIPVEWEVKTLGSLVEVSAPICYGVVQVGKDIEGGVPIIAIKYVKRIESSPLHKAAVELERLFTRSRVKPGDVLISIKGTIGRVGIVPIGFVGNISRELARLRLAESAISAYLAHQLEAGTTQERITSTVVGTTRLELSIFALREFDIPLPPLPEQRAIAEALSDVDALLASLDTLIAKKRDLKQAAMQQLLTGKIRLPGFEGKGYKQTDSGLIPEDWKLERIGSLASIKTGDKNTQDNVADGAYPFFVRSSIVERINSYAYDGEAVLTAGDGVGTGKVFHYYNGKFDLHQRVYRICEFAPALHGRFFYLVFSTKFYDRIMAMTAKSSVDSVRMEMIADMKIPLPPLPEQRAIAEVLSDMDAEIAALEQRRDKTRALKQGMMQELLTGRTRLLSPDSATRPEVKP